MSEKPHKAETVANFVGRDVLALVVNELKQAQKPWHKLSESQQETVIRRIENDVRGVLTKGFLLIVAADFQKAGATLDQVAFTAKGVVGKLTLKGDAAERHRLADCAGQEVVVILTSAKQYLAKMEEVQADADQRPLPLVGPTDENGGGVDGPDADDGEVLPIDEHNARLDKLTEEALHDVGISYACVRDMLSLVGVECSAEIVGTWNERDRRAVIDYAGAKHVATTSENYLTKGGRIPALPEVLGGAAP